jgi:hypothetical protein
MAKTLIGILVALLFLQRAANAQYWLDGNALLTYCTGTDAAQRSACTLYIEGVWDTIYNAQGTKAVSGSAACISFSTAVTSGQVADTVTHWLQAHPAVRHLPAGGLVWGALYEAWPCPAH